MNEAVSAPPVKTKSAARQLLESGVIFSVISFATGLINFAFQGLIARRFNGHEGEYGLTNNATSLVGLLGLPLMIATTAITHYIAHFHAKDDQARLRGLLLGCRKVLLWFTIGGSLLAAVLVVPLSQYFNFPRYSLMLVALLCVLAGLWGAFATALCQGLGWFKRLAIIGFLSAILRCAFTWATTVQHPIAEYAVASAAVAFLANIVLLYWWKDIFQHGEAVSPWDREFILYLVAGTACMAGNFFFLQSDPLIAQRYFGLADIDHYSTANRLAAALPMVAGPLLIVLFTARSRARSADAASAQYKLLGLYSAGLVIGVLGLLIFRNICVRLIRGHASPEAADMLAPLSWTMVFGGLLQALAMWALASRWIKATLLYGVLGLAYWFLMLGFGQTPAALLHLMPLASGLALVGYFVIWMVTMKRSHAHGL